MEVLVEHTNETQPCLIQNLNQSSYKAKWLGFKTNFALYLIENPLFLYWPFGIDILYSLWHVYEVVFWHAGHIIIPLNTHEIFHIFWGTSISKSWKQWTEVSAKSTLLVFRHLGNLGWGNTPGTTPPAGQQRRLLSIMLSKHWVRRRRKAQRTRGPFQYKCHISISRIPLQKSDGLYIYTTPNFHQTSGFKFTNKIIEISHVSP